MTNKLLSKVRGCIFGGAIGDAMGGPVETMHYKKIKRIFGKVTKPMEYKSPPGHIKIDPESYYVKKPDAGTYTDDTRGRNLIVKAVLEKGGRINADDFGKIILRDLNPEHWWPAIMVSYYKMKFYNISVRDAGQENLPGGGVAWYTPIGIVNACDPRQAAWDTFDVCSFLKRGFDRELTCAVQAAVAEAFKPNATIDSVVQMAMEYISKDSARYIERAINLAKKCDEVEELYEKFYDNFLVDWDASFQNRPSRLPSEATSSCDLREQVPAALAMFYFCKGDAKETIIAAVNFGRDADTIATTAGSIAGAFSGIETIPEEWIQICLRANPEPDLNKLCDDLYNILRKEVNIKKEQIEWVKQLGLND